MTDIHKIKKLNPDQLQSPYREELFITLWVALQGDADACRVWLVKMGASTVMVGHFNRFAREAKGWYDRAVRIYVLRDVVSRLRRLLTSSSDSTVVKAITVALQYFSTDDITASADEFLQKINDRHHKFREEHNSSNFTRSGRPRKNTTIDTTEE